MKGFTILASALLVACAEQAPRVATSIELTPQRLSFDALGDSAMVIATVKDQFGNHLNVSVRWTLNNGNSAISPSDTARELSKPAANLGQTQRGIC